MAIEKSKENISLLVLPSKKLPDLTISLCIGFDCSHHCLSQLKYGQVRETCAVTHKGAEEAALAYAVFENISNKLMGTPLEMMKSRVSRVSCDVQNKQFIVNWNTQGAISTLGRSMALALMALTPAKVFPKYTENMRLLGGVGKRGEFNKCVAEMIAAIKKNVSFMAVGRVNITTAKAADVVSKLLNKRPVQESPSAKEQEKLTPKQEYVADYPTVNAAGIAAVAVADYIENKLSGMNVIIDSGKVIVLNKSFETKRASIKQAAKIKDFVAKKYERLGDEFHVIFAYMAMAKYGIDCHTVKRIINTPPSAKAMVEHIQKAL